jgi:hypothetical protein
MALDAHVLKILIASPGDTVEERDAVERALYGWNGDRGERNLTLQSVERIAAAIKVEPLELLRYKGGPRTRGRASEPGRHLGRSAIPHRCRSLMVLRLLGSGSPRARLRLLRQLPQCPAQLS